MERINKVYLNRNEFPFPPSLHCMQVLQSIPYRTVTTYSAMDVPESATLKHSIAALIDVPEKNIMLGHGAEELLKLFIHHAFDNDGYALIEDCSWWFYTKVVQERGLLPVYWNAKENKNHFAFSFDSFYAAYQQYRPKLVVLASPNNPTGHSIALHTLEHILKITGDSVVIVDEAYWGFQNLNSQYCFDLIKRYPNAIFIRSFSKFFGLPGARMGYAICNNEQYQKIFQYNDNYLGYNKISLDLCVAAIEDIDYYCEVSHYYQNIKEEFYKEFFDNFLINAYRSDANFILFKIHPSIKAYLAHSFERHGYMVSFLNKEPLQNFIRISLGNEQQNRDVIKLLKRAIHYYYRTTVKAA